MAHNAKYLNSVDDDCVVVNGFFPSLTLKSILTSISEDILEIDSTFSSNPEHVDAILREKPIINEKSWAFFSFMETEMIGMSWVRWLTNPIYQKPIIDRFRFTSGENELILFWPLKSLNSKRLRLRRLTDKFVTTYSWKLYLDFV